MNLPAPPKSLDFGSGKLYEIDYLCQTLKLHRATALLYLAALHIKPLYIGKEIYFSIDSFNRIMFVLSKPNSPGFLFPGSYGKHIANRLKKQGFIDEVTPEMTEQASKPETLIEMMAVSGRHPEMLKRLTVKPVGRPPQVKKE